MQSNLSDNESSTGSSGHKKEALVRYRCPRCSQVFFCEKYMKEQEVESDEMTKVTRNVLNFTPPTRTNYQRATPPPPPRVRRTHTYSQPRRAGADASHSHRNHPYQRRKSPVVVLEEDHANDDGSKRTRDFLSLFNGPNPTGHGSSSATSDRGFTKLAPRGPIGWGYQEPNSIKWGWKELDLKLKLWV